jgi:hypothetical protein
MDKWASNVSGLSRVKVENKRTVRRRRPNTLLALVRDRIHGRLAWNTWQQRKNGALICLRGRLWQMERLIGLGFQFALGAVSLGNRGEIQDVLEPRG